MLLNNDNGVFVTARFTGHAYDTVLDMYFAQARFYDAKNRQWLSSDPMRSGLNWYQYAGANPTTFIDPWGLVLVDILEYANTYPGATVTVDPSGHASTRVTVNWGRLSFKINDSDLSIVDGRLVADDKLFIDAFGLGGNQLTVYHDATTNSVSIRAYFRIFGCGAHLPIGGSTYRELFLSGVEDWWSDLFRIYDVSVHTAESLLGILVNIVDGVGTAHVNYPRDANNNVDWSPTNVGNTTVYTHFTNGTIRTEDEFAWVSAHEFGHLLGLTSLNPGGNSSTRDIMGELLKPPTEPVIESVLEAHRTGKLQYLR